MNTHTTIKIFVFLALSLAAGWGAATALGQEGSWGHMKGQIVLGGSIPEKEKVTPTKAEDVKYCKENGIVLFKEDWVVDEKTKGVRGVFVMMYHGRDADGGGKKVKVHESYDQVKEVIVDNNKMRFAPHDIIVRFGQKVILRNSDKVGHNVRVASGKNVFNALVPGLSDVDITSKMNEADRLPQTMECNLHDWMKGRFLVRQSPYNIVTDKEGKFEIKNLPAGKHEFQFWQTKYVELKDGNGKVLTGRRGVIKVEIKEGETLDLGTMTMEIK